MLLLLEGRGSADCNPATMSCTPSLPRMARSAPEPSPLATELLLRILRPGCVSPTPPVWAQTIVTSTRLDTAPETSPFATELLLRLLGAGSAQAILTSLDKPSSVNALINDPGPTAARHAPASRYYGESRGTAQSSAGGFDGWQSHLSSDPPIDRVDQREFLNDESGRQPRLRRRQMLNDVSGRERKVFRRSPCPPRARSSSQDYDDDASG